MEANRVQTLTPTQRVPLQLRIFLFFTAARKYHMVQLDLTNAYLHAPMKDTVYIIIPEGFPGQGEVARLDKVAYGTDNASTNQLINESTNQLIN